MSKLGQSSFRRILLSRILLLSVPVLLMGEYVTYKKARTSLLETARQNLTESAVRKGEAIQDTIQALQANVITAAQSAVLKSDRTANTEKFLAQLAKQLPTKVQCIQLANLETGKIVASTCGERPIGSILRKNTWPQQQNQLLPDRSSVNVTPLFSRKSTEAGSQAGEKPETTKLQLILSAPVYNNADRLQNVLRVQLTLNQQQRDRSGSLYGYTVVIDQNGTILEHPSADREGRNISQEPDASRLKRIVTKALAGEQDFSHIFGFQNKSVESVVGYTAIPSPLNRNPNDKWIILAVASIDNALFRLEEIKQVLIVLTLGLIAAILLATLYLSRDLARPLEKLGEYAVNVGNRRSPSKIPHNFKIRELNQLAESLNSMVERLTVWAEELEKAWKEAQTANQLKSEFLANTSHELRTPLNAIIGCIRLVRDGCCDDRDEEMELLQRADEAAIHLLNIINDILDLSKVESGNLSVVTRPVDLQSAIKEVIDLQIVHLNQKGLQLIWSPQKDSIVVQADPAKLKQVFLNVIANAVKFTEKGSITITTRLEVVPDKQHSSNNSWVFLSVRDTGIGVPVDQQQKLFRPFVMADGTRTRKYGGTGLGLAISRKIMALMEGTITLHSAGAGLGTTVEIAMPVVNSSRLPTHTSESSTDMAEVPSVSER